MNTSNQAAGQSAGKQASQVFYAIKARCQWPRSLCALCRQPMDHGDRAYAVFQGDVGILCRACAAQHATDLARAVEHLYAPRHISGADRGGLPLDVVVRAEMPLAKVTGKLRELADALEGRADADAPCLGPAPDQQ